MEATNQTERIIQILALLSMGRKLTCSKLHDKFEHKVSLRTIQRDMMRIESAEIPLLIEKGDQGENVYTLPAAYRHMVIPSIQQNELLALYMLKAYLNTFRGTRIEEYLQNLLQKLEDMAPGDVYLYLADHKDIFWSQDAGQYDYGNRDHLLNEVLNLIKDEKWATITYRSLASEHSKTYDVFMYRLFSYKGVLYIAAYNPLYDNYISLALHRIEAIDEARNQKRTRPGFSVDAFRDERFGVFAGEVQHIRLQIRAEYTPYFVNRSWHPSQRNEMLADGGMMMHLQAPVSPELISWILGWHEALMVLQPQSLIAEITGKLEKMNTMYGL